MNRKSVLAEVAIKAPGDGVPEGSFRATISTFNVKDLDGDVTLPGAFPVGKQIKIAAWGHNWSVPNIGTGVIGADETRAWVDGRLFLAEANPRAIETYSALKGNGPSQEWSYGFNVLESGRETHDGEEVNILRKVDPFEASPVMLGAGIDTNTEYIKGSKHTIPSHASDVVEGKWDGIAELARIPLLTNRDTMRKWAAWAMWSDPCPEADQKDAYLFGHHLVAEDGTVGAASLEACIKGIATLNGGRVRDDFPETDRESVFAHLAKHIRDAGAEPPALKTGITQVGDDVISAMGQIIALQRRIAPMVAERREKDGRVLSAANRSRLTSLMEAMRTAMTDVEELLAASEPAPKELEDATIRLRRIRAQFEMVGAQA